MTSPSDHLRVALVGYGVAGSVFHAPLISAVDGLRLSAVVTSNAERAAEVRTRYGEGVRILDDASSVFADPSAFDLVVVAAPNKVHRSLALDAIAAGLPVVVDKPVGLTAAEVREVVEAASGAGVGLTAFHNRRWDADFLTLRRLLAEGALGAPARLESRFERWRPQPKAGSWRESEPPSAGGGLLLDLGTHLVDQAVQLFGRPVAVYAELDARRGGVQAEDDVFVALHFAGGERAHLWASAVAGQLGPRLRLLGSEGAFVVPELDGQEAALREGRGPGSPGWGETPRAAWGLLGADEETLMVEPDRGAYEAFYAGVVSWLREGAPPPVDPRDAVVVAEVLDAARVSADEGAVVPIGSA